MSALDKIAPYPKSEREATAEAMARSFAAHAQLHFRISVDHPYREQAAKSAHSFVSYYTITYLLRELEERAGTEQADQVARRLWDDQDVGDGLGRDVWEWLSEEYGIDPERINKIAAEVCGPNPEAGTQAGTGGAA